MSSRKGRKAWSAVLATAVLAVGLLTAGSTSNIAAADEFDPNLATTSDHTYNFTVKLDIGAGKRGCSGALVDPSWVMTAASCFVDNPAAGINLAAGAPADATVVTVRSGVVQIPVGQPTQYNVTQLVPRADRDVVLAKLSTPVRLPVATISLGTAPAQGDTLLATGLGRTRTEWASTFHYAAFTVGTVTPTGIDLAAPSGSDAVLCKGDTGGPAFKSIDETPDIAAGPHHFRYELVAIHSRSWQNGCVGSTETTHSGAYDTRVDDLGPWLQENGIYQASKYTPLANTRVMDTRYNGGTRTWPAVTGLNAGQKILDLGPNSTGAFKLPQGTTAVVLNLTVVNPTNAGWLTATSNDKTRPTTSSINFAAGQILSNLVTVPVDKDGKVHLITNTSDFDAIVDVAGYYSPASPNKFDSVTPVRILDTRTTGGPIGAGATRDLQVTGQNGVPADATAAVVTLTTVGSTQGGYLTTYAAGSTRPAPTSNINFPTGAILSNQAIVPIGAGGKITLYNFAGTSNVLVDLAGYYSPSATQLFHPLDPTRLLDTRTNNGSPLTYEQVKAIDIPYSASAVVVNATTVASDGIGYFTLFPHGTTRPATSSINFTVGAILSAPATVATGSGKIDLYNHVNHSHAIADLEGYFR